MRAVHRRVLFPKNRQPYLGLIGTRCAFPDTLTTSGSFAEIVTGTRHTARAPVSSLQVVFPGFYCSSLLEIAATGDTTITASISANNGGPWTRINFSGVTNGIIPAGGVLVSDPVAFQLFDGQPFFIRNWRRNVNGILSSQFQGIGAVGDWASFGVTTADRTMFNGVLTGGGGTICGPCAIIGQARRPSVGIIGDSRAYNGNDTGDSQGEIGEVCRSIGPSFGYINASRISLSPSAYNNSHAQRQALIDAYCTHVVCEMGVNAFLQAGQNLAACEASMQTLWALQGTKPVFQTTVSPVSSGAWTNPTGADQTASQQPNISGLNTYFRSVPAPLAGCFDTAPIVSLPGNPDKWNAPGYTTDGIHATQLGNLAIRNSGRINVSLIRR